MKKSRWNMILCAVLATGILVPLANSAFAQEEQSNMIDGTSSAEVQEKQEAALGNETGGATVPGNGSGSEEVMTPDSGSESEEETTPDSGTESEEVSTPDGGSQSEEVSTPDSGNESGEETTPDSGTEFIETATPDSGRESDETTQGNDTASGSISNSEASRKVSAKSYTDGNTEVKAPVFVYSDSVLPQQFKDLKLSKTQIEELVRMTRGEMREERLQVVLHAYSLVGKVNYFWGGKSSAIGWDSRWGMAATVTSEGNDTTGTIRTDGLDCSGYVTWAFLNAAGNRDIIKSVGHGTTAQWANSSAIEEKEALPGDLAFMAPGGTSVNHVGIVIGRNMDGQLMFAHCSGGYNNVVVTTAKEGCFRYLRRPNVYTDETIEFSKMVHGNPKAMTENNKELYEKYQDLSLMKNEG